MTILKNKAKNNAFLSNRPIGVFDSGVGGISVLKHVRTALPDEDLLYCADSRFAPYGNKSPELIRERSIFLADFLIAQGAKALVIACNTATAAAVAALRERYDMPIIGMEPAVKPAAAATKTGVIGVLATSGTLKSAQFAALLESYGQNVKVVTEACHGLVERIEQGEVATEATKALLSRYLKPLQAANADTIVLGCTHYPFVRQLIEELVGQEVVLVDTGAAVAKHLKHRLQEAGLLADAGQSGRVSQSGQVKFWTNSQAPDAKQVILQLWGASAEVAVLESPG